MRKFLVTVKFEGTKTYEVDAEDMASVERKLEESGSLDHYDNPIDESVDETIVKIEEKAYA